MSRQNETLSPSRVASAIALNVGLLLIVAGTVMPLLHQPMTVARWIYAAGAVLAIIGRFTSGGDAGEDVPFRAKRLMRLEKWSVIIFAVAVFFMFYPDAGPTDWIAFTLAGGFLQAYASIMIPRAMRKK